MSDPLRAGILAAADAVDAARAELGRLDGAAGDGDHGMTMSIGARNVRKRLAALPGDASPTDLVRAAAESMAAVGGAIGPLHAGALTAIAAEVESPAWSSMGDVARLRTIAEAAERAITDLGHAATGDKTIVDALHPLVASLRESEAAGLDPAAAVEAAIAAAEAGAASTSDMVARIGRASRLGERSRGLPDAGATSFAIIARSLAESLVPGVGGTHGATA